MSSEASTPCPCGSGQKFAECCELIHQGKPASTAEQLMRARYSAYVHGNIDFIVSSHDPQTAGSIDRDASLAWSKQSTWLGLEIVDTSAGGANDHHGIVEFVARFSLQGAEQRHHERARFHQHEGKWFYLDGDIVKNKPVVRQESKVGRNDPCPCGSEKKYKKCHGAA